MKKSKTSQRWLTEHEQDPFVLKARAAGYRSRAVYKLLELDGIGPKRVDTIVNAWDEQKSVRNIMVYLQSHGVGTAKNAMSQSFRGFEYSSINLS